DRAVDLRRIHLGVAQPCPVLRVEAQIRGCGARPLRLHLLESLPVESEGLVGGGQTLQQSMYELRRFALRGRPVIHPMLFAKTDEESRAEKEAQMARHPRLALPEDARNLAHGQLALRADGEHPQACRLGRCAQSIE